jgi:hypothetical protein
VRLEALGKLKKFTSSGLDPATFLGLPEPQERPKIEPGTL